MDGESSGEITSVLSGLLQRVTPPDILLAAPLLFRFSALGLAADVLYGGLPALLA